MTNWAFPRIFLLLLTLTLLGEGCKNPCKDVTCSGQGTCDEGNCLCTAGYEGEDCELRLNDRYDGTYALVESCSTGPNEYECAVISPEDAPLDIRFSNLLNASIETRAVVSEDGSTFTIPSQPFLSATISGSGTINSAGTEMTVTYTVVVFSNTTTCTATLTR
jgi:EGF-like domain